MVATGNSDSNENSGASGAAISGWTLFILLIAVNAAAAGYFVWKNRSGKEVQLSEDSNDQEKQNSAISEQKVDNNVNV